MKTLFLDMETQALSSDKGPDGREIGWTLERRGMMGASWACAATDTGLMLHYCWQEMDKLASRLEHADLVVSFNGKSFDLPLLSAVVEREVQVQRHCDLMDFVKRSLGHRLSLDQLAHINLGTGKTGHGGHAPTLYREERYGALAAYCARDVEILRDLYYLGLSRGALDAPGGRKILTPRVQLQCRQVAA